ncbi:MAG TPA: hypothetical protein VFV58_24305 [Blastocatellia bacterium]|jgi:hypothetical protein|nr:hypothetical protein [Blastocatellia bacterium]
MNNPDEKDIAAEYIALKAANDELRERGKQWLWNTLDVISSEISRELSDRNKPPLQVGRQEWQFKVEDSTMVGERFGARFREKTLVVEAGWPREPQHRFVPDRGLARARIGFSQNVMLEAKIVAEMILKRQNNGDLGWNFITDKKLGAGVTDSHLREYFNLIIAD